MRLFLLALSLQACGSPEDTSETGAPAPTDVTLTDADNYAYEATIDVQVVPFAAGTDGFIGWAGITVDWYGRPLDPADVARMDVLNFEVDPEELLRDLASNNVQASDLTLTAYCEPEDLGCWLDDFTVGITHPLPLSEYTLEGSGNWLFALSTSLGAGFLAVLGIEPLDASAVTEAEITDDASRFVVESDLATAGGVEVAAEGATLDWSLLTTDGAGEPLALYRLDRATLAWFSGGVEAAAAAPHLLAESADEVFGLDVASRTSAALSEFTDGAGAAADLTAHADGAWVFALSCSTCAAPMPDFLAVLLPR